MCVKIATFVLRVPCAIVHRSFLSSIPLSACTMGSTLGKSRLYEYLCGKGPMRALVSHG